MKVILSFVILIFSISMVSSLDVKKDGEIGIDLISQAASRIRTFLRLSDTPSSYSGEGGNCVKVNAGEDALEFGDCGGAGGADGNASSICNDGEYLDGNGNCINFNNTCTDIAEKNTYNATYDAYVTANYSNNSNYWDTLNTYNSTQMEDSGGILNILESWLKSIFYTETEVDDLIAGVDGFVNETGDNMTGNLNMNYPNNITFAGNITIWYNGSDLIIE